MKEYLLTAGRMVVGLLIVALSYGQEQQLTVFGTAEGLSDNQVADVHRDKLGYLWVATGHGLNLYNGIDFQVFRYNPQDTTSIRANSLEFLYEDHQSNIWVALTMGGVNKYNRAQDRFEYFTHNPSNGNDPNNFVTDVLVDSQKRTWIGTNSHMNLLDSLTGLYHPIPVEGQQELEVYKIFEDSRHNIWIGTSKGLFHKSRESRYFTEVLNGKGEKMEEIFRFVEDKEDQLWLSSYYHVYQLQSEVPVEIKSPHERFIASLFSTKKGNVLISQYEDHIYEWDGTAWKMIKTDFTTTDQLRYAFANEEMSRIMIEDNEGNLAIYDEETGKTRSIARLTDNFNSFWFGAGADELWIGTVSSGLLQLNLRTPYITQQQLNPPDKAFVYAHHTGPMVSLPNGSLVIHEGASLHYYNPATASSQPLTSKDIQELTRSGISAMALLNEKELLVAAGNGLHRLDLKSKKIEKLDYLADTRTFEFLIKGDNLWSIGQYGLALRNLKTGQETHFKDLQNTPESLTNGSIRSIYLDEANILWVGTVREGLFKIEFSKGQKGYAFENFQYAGASTEPFLSHTVNDILEDKAGRLWIAGFSSGLLEFDREQEVFINHNPPQELPIPNIQALELAQDGSLWMSALNGIHRYDPQDGSFHKFTTRDGLRSTAFNLRASAKATSGQLLFGSDQGFALLDPAKFQPQTTPHSVLIEALHVNSDGSLFKEPPTALAQQLTHEQNFISFDFIALDYHTPEKLVYQYRLEGLEIQWNTGRSRQVQYANLPPGAYTFLVRAGTDSSYWTETPTSLSFTIANPFWLQLWFQALVLLSVGLLIYGVYRFRLNLRRSKARVLENIRQSAAADFHDELGNKLTRIALFSEVLEQKLDGSSPEISSYVSKIKDNSHVLNNSMRDFLWALDPAKDTTLDLIILLKDFGDEFFDNSGVHFHGASIKAILREYPLDMDWKRHLVMIFKEAMHNALKYSMAKNVTLKASLSKDVLNLSLTDDGQGFDPLEIDNGYGQAKMKRRAEHLGASVSIESKTGIGTVVTFIGTLTKKHETYD